MLNLSIQKLENSILGSLEKMDLLHKQDDSRLQPEESQ